MSAQRTINRNIPSRRGFRYWRLFLPFSLVWLLLLSSTGRAELTLPSISTGKKKKDSLTLPQTVATAPLGVPQEATVAPGAQVEIPLTVHGRRGARIRYRIRQNPKLGKVVGIRQEQVDRATLVYEHTASMGGGANQTDLFYFVAVDENGSSAPVPVTINIIDQPPQFLLPGQIRFGAITIGDEAVKSVTIRNEGGGIAEGAFEVDPPWQVNPARYRIGRGETVEVQLSLRAAGETSYQGRLRMPQHTDRVIELLATGIFPIVPETQEVTLSDSPDTSLRSGTLTLRNRTKIPRTFSLTTPSERLQLPGEPLTLAPDEETTVTLTLPAKDLKAFEGDLEIVYGDHRKKVAVQGEAVAVRLITRPEELQWGEIETGREHPRTFTVENRGGSTASVVITAPEPFTASPDRFELAPAASQKITFIVSPAWPGTLSAKATLQTAGVSLAIPLHAEIIRHRERSNASSPSRPSPAAERLPSNDVDKNKMMAAQMVVSPEVTEIRPTSITLQWKPPTDAEEKPLALDYQIEARQILLAPTEADTAEGALHIQWVPIPTADISTGDSGVEAKITALPAQASATVRIVAIDREDARRTVIGQLSFSLPPKPVYFTLRRFLLVGFGVILIAAIWLRTGRSLFGVTLQR